jgi:multidrug resistance efflux pump
VLGEIIDVNKRVRTKMKNANEAIDETHEKIKKANKKADKLIVRVKKADKDLAEILKTYQRPSQLCLNVTLILMVLALIAVIINLIRGQTV